MKQKVIRQSHEICIERAILITESYRKTKRDLPAIRFAKAIKHILQNMTIKIWDDEVIVGNRCSKLVGTPLYPEIRVDTLFSIYSNSSMSVFVSKFSSIHK